MEKMHSNNPFNILLLPNAVSHLGDSCWTCLSKYLCRTYIQK